MRTILLVILFAIYTLVSMSVLSICIVLPLACEDFPIWFSILIVILSIIIGITQQYCLNYFQKELNF